MNARAIFRRLWWSPDGTRVFAATTGPSFLSVSDRDLDYNSVRQQLVNPTIFALLLNMPHSIFDTQSWACVRWETRSAPVTAGCWSPCGQYFLWATRTEPCIRYLQVRRAKIFCQWFFIDAAVWKKRLMPPGLSPWDNQNPSSSSRICLWA